MKLNGIGLVIVLRCLYDHSAIKILVHLWHTLNGSYDVFGYKWREDVNRRLSEGQIPTKQGWVKPK